ncbi:MAG: hypothetical protein OHK0013_00440 [Sandaracinaceae bacterium]
MIPALQSAARATRECRVPAARPSLPMRTLQPLLAALALLVGPVSYTARSAPAAADALPPAMQEGTIVSIDTAQSVIVIATGARQRRARFGPLTTVRIGGLPGTVTDLRPGMRVAVRFASSESGREGTMLVSIDAFR